MASELEFDQNISITEIDANFYVFSTKLASDAVRKEWLAPKWINSAFYRLFSSKYNFYLGILLLEEG